ESKVLGMLFGWYPFSTYAFGSAIDSWTNACSGRPARFADALRLSSAGPVVPLEPAAAKVWQPAQPALLNVARAGPPAPDPELCLATVACCALTQAWKARGVITTACVPMTAWPSPQSSVQTTG